jgi:hypothetical protein
MNRRKFLQYLAITGAIGMSGLMGYRRWQDETANQAVTSAKIFTPAPAADDAPLLLVTNGSTNPFGIYLGEILRTEGLNLFRTMDIQELSHETLQPAALVVLAEGQLEPDQARMLERYVAAGGRLVALRPEAGLMALFGVEREAGTTAEGYMQINPEQPIGNGLAGETLQFHGQANHYRAPTATVVAWLYSDIKTPTGLPAVMLQPYDRGWVALWAFDLARSIAYTRQGNPLWTYQERDGVEGLRAQEAFFDWIDLERITIPQADEQMRLFCQLISEMLSEALPLPRLWYFPEASPAMLVVTGDSHANSAGNIEAILSVVESYQGNMSIFYTPAPRSDNSLRRAASLVKQRVENWFDPLPNDPTRLPTPAQVEQWRTRGHEFSLHPYVEEGVEQGYQSYAAAFEAEGYGLPATRTVRTHRVLWEGWVETARVQAAQGFGMNFDFYQIGPLLQTDGGDWRLGYFTGSGLPMRMIDEAGQIIDVYQLLTELIDEQLLKGVNKGWMELDPQAAIALSRAMIDNAMIYHTALTTQFHIDFYHPTSPVRAEVEEWARGVLAYAAEKDLPIWSAARLLDFVRCRDDAAFHDLTWDNEAGRLSFRLLTPAGNEQFQFITLIPATGVTGSLDLKLQAAAQNVPTGAITRIEIDGQPANYFIRPVAGIAYAWLTLPPGQHSIEVWYKKI